jgi:hypothetical protein
MFVASFFFGWREKNGNFKVGMYITNRYVPILTTYIGNGTKFIKSSNSYPEHFHTEYHDGKMVT